MDDASRLSSVSAGPHVAMVVEQLCQPIPGGSGTYITELAHALMIERVPVAGLVAAHRRCEAGELGLPPSMRLRSAPLPRTVLYEAWNWLRWPRGESVVPGADLVHATTWAIPPTRLPLVVTVHDVAFERSPEHFTTRGAMFFRRCLHRTVREASRVIVPSRATADDCVKAGIEASRIEVIPHGVRTRLLVPGQVEEFRLRHGLERDYILWTGTREPRKNLSGLLEAFAIAAPHRPDLDLVLVGPVGWGEDASAHLPAEIAPRVHVLGRVSEEDLAAAYRGASALCFPSHWEGFGLPVLEAMAYGTPVVTSRGTCMEEVCGDAGLLADPHSPAEIAAALIEVTGPRQAELAEASVAQAQRFTWQASAQAHAQVYRAAAGDGR